MSALAGFLFALFLIGVVLTVIGVLLYGAFGPDITITVSRGRVEEDE